MARGQHRHVIEPPKRSLKDKLLSTAFLVEEGLIVLLLILLFVVLSNARDEEPWLFHTTAVVCMLVAVLLPSIRGRLRHVVLRKEPRRRGGHRVIES